MRICLILLFLIGVLTANPAKAQGLPELNARFENPAPAPRNYPEALKRSAYTQLSTGLYYPIAPALTLNFEYEQGLGSLGQFTARDAEQIDVQLLSLGFSYSF